MMEKPVTQAIMVDTVVKKDMVVMEDMMVMTIIIFLDSTAWDTTALDTTALDQADLESPLKLNLGQSNL